MIVGAFGLCLQGLMRVALETQPVLPEELYARATARVRPLIDRARRLPWLPTATVAGGAFAYAVYFSIITIQNHYRLGTSGYDLGIENNLVWNAAHANGPLFKSSVIGGPTSTHLGLHTTWISYLIAIPYRLLPRPETLLVLQAMLIGGAALPLYAFARRHIGDWLACLVGLLFLLYPPLHGSNLYDFHYLPFAPFFLWTTLALLEAKRDRWAVVAVVLTLANREDMSALLAVLGVYMVLAGRRPRAGMILAAVGAVYFVIVKMIWMPRLLGGGQAYSDQYQDLIPHGEHGFGGVLKTVFANPAFTIGSLIERDKLSYLLQIMAPLAFFAWRRPIGALCTVPGFFFTLLSTRYPALVKISFQYTAYWTSFLFIAVVENFAWLKRGAATAASPAVAAQRRVSLRAWAVAMTVAMLATSYQLGVVFQRNTAWGGFLKFDVGDHARGQAPSRRPVRADRADSARRQRRRQRAGRRARVQPQERLHAEDRAQRRGLPAGQDAAAGRRARPRDRCVAVGRLRAGRPAAVTSRCSGAACPPRPSAPFLRAHRRLTHARRTRRRRCWLVLLAATAGAAGCRRAARRAAAAGPATCWPGVHPARSAGARNPDLITDGRSVPEGEEWGTSAGAVLDGDRAYVDYDLGRAAPIGAVYVQGDNNDSYVVSVSDDGVNFRELWASPSVAGAGMRERVPTAWAPMARWLRVSARGGDGMYAVVELQAFSERPSEFPPRPGRAAGARDPDDVRTALLYLVLAFVVLLAATGAGSSWLRVAPGRVRAHRRGHLRLARGIGRVAAVGARRGVRARGGSGDRAGRR